MSHILLVEDDPILGRGLSVSLETEGYQVSWAKNLQESYLKNDELELDLVVLDLGLPDGNGLNFCKRVRANGSTIPIIVLTASIAEDVAVDCLDSGVNDFIRKPFGNRELMARIRNLLNEKGPIQTKFRFGELLLIPENRSVFYKKKELTLNKREFDILLQLVKSNGSILTREKLLDGLDSSESLTDRTIDSHLSHLRSKLKKVDPETVKIRPVYGIGYKLEKG